MKRYSLFLNGKLIKSYQREGTIKKYFDIYIQDSDNSVYVIDNTKEGKIIFSTNPEDLQTQETEKQKVSQKYSKDTEKKINTFVSGFMEKYGNIYKNAFNAIGACRADIKASVKDDLNNLFRPSQIFFYSDIVADRILDIIQANNK